MHERGLAPARSAADDGVLVAPKELVHRDCLLVERSPATNGTTQSIVPMEGLLAHFGIAVGTDDEAGGLVYLRERNRIAHAEALHRLRLDKGAPLNPLEPFRQLRAVCVLAEQLQKALLQVNQCASVEAYRVHVSHCVLTSFQSPPAPALTFKPIAVNEPTPANPTVDDKKVALTAYVAPNRGHN